MMKSGGKLVIVAIFLLAAAAGGFAVWHRAQSGHRIKAAWGKGHIRRIAQATRVEALRLQRADATSPRDAAASSEILNAGLDRYRVEQRADISHARGLVHVRATLVEDASYEWNPDMCNPVWQYGLRFQDQGGNTTIAISLDCPRLMPLDSAAAAATAPTADWLRGFLEEQFPHSDGGKSGQDNAE